MKAVLPILLAVALGGARADIPPFTEHYFTQTVDHFRYSNDTATYQQRYLMNDQYYTGAGALPGTKCKGPILFYTGNEGPIDAFWGSNGFMLEVLAPKLGALAVFGEHRYYGKSSPVPAGAAAPWSHANAAYLTTEQALADYVALLAHVKATVPGAAGCPVIAFGGSYGGTLTTYLRTKYPAVVAGGLAASAPVGYYAHAAWPAHGVDAFTWMGVVNRDYSETQHGAPGECLARLGAAVAAVRAAEKTNLAALEAALHLCPARAGDQPVEFFVTDALESTPQMDYPYAIGAMPAWPVNATCETIMGVADMNDQSAVLSAVGELMARYYAYDGKTCLPNVGQGGVPGNGPWPANAWGYQSCTETLHQFSTPPGSWRNFTFDLAAANANCATWYGVTPRPAYTEAHFGGFSLAETATNLIWSNGLLDPWHGGGYLTAPADAAARGVHLIQMPRGAHHLDLRGPHPQDPPDVTAARALEEEIIRGWIDDAAEALRAKEAAAMV